MRVAAIIAEYNPFHLGHKYHITKTRELSGADFVIAVMSGDYVQRGEPAIFDKYIRTRYALQSGIDLVIELPVAYATGSAGYFAMGGVKLLDQLHCVDVLSFGSEWAGTNELNEVFNILKEEPPAYKILFKEGLRKGMNFPKAREYAIKEYLKDIESEVMWDRYAGILSQPNHILALEYIRALSALSSSIEPMAVKRMGSDYHETELSRDISSATAVRNALKNHIGQELLFQAVGDCASSMIQHYDEGNTLDWEDLMPYFHYAYLFERKHIGNYFGMNLELGRRLEHNYKADMSFTKMLSALHSKNMTDTAIKRALLHVVLQMKGEPYLGEAKDIITPYIRVLGFRARAAKLIKKIRESTPLTVIQKPSAGFEQLKHNELGMWLYKQDILASNLYEQLCAKKSGRSPVDEFERQQIIIS